MSQEGMRFPTNVPLEILLVPRSRNRAKISRSQNSFILYRKDLKVEIQRQNPHASLGDISKIISEKWKNESTEKRNFFTVLSRISFLIHDEISGVKNNKQLNSEDAEKEKEPWRHSASTPQMVLWPTELQEISSIHTKDSFYLQPTGIEHHSPSNEETGSSRFLRIHNLIN
ncbi:12810_t:CDS:1 [Funneliformis geosporum]|uniref:4899_t:CDS:1 n=1 Tax=Funneliformis geosporum TaxID=1117311 RepID=A0A9W4WZ75_9GLOM|nr:12810_t:CDS:1 [Funneliformis geosporum]CAI2174527.1 4899_t:CDS:1 [Funneliformis geosporum]